jgi:hypothetical protein
MAYQLKLPAHARIHDVFHVKFLRKFVCGRVVPQPEQVLRARPSASSWELLVHWVDQLVAAATWEALEEFKEAYPEFLLEDKLFQQEGGGNVMDSYFGKQYRRRIRKGKEAISG